MSIITYKHILFKGDGDFKTVDEFTLKIPHKELSILYGAHCVRFKTQGEAEKNLVDYYHPEPIKVGGKTRPVEIRDALNILKLPFLAKMEKETGTKEATVELQKILQNSTEWNLKMEVGMQAIASIGWLMDLAKARPPAITTDKTSHNYEEELLPSNLQIKEEIAPSGYNEGQVKLLTDTKEIAAEVLQLCGEEGNELKEMGIVLFGERVFKTYSMIFNALPDPEDADRKQFEEMRAIAAKNKEEGGDG